MLPEYKTKTNIGVGSGILLQIAGRTLSGPVDAGPAGIGGLLILAGLVPFIWGCCMYAKGKGHSGAWGLLGLFSIIGLIILVCFPDKHK